MRFVLTVALAASVAGCVLPPAVTIGSYAADGVSYLLTGKSVTDHALSEVVGEDCATWRLIKLENPCRPYEDEPAAVDDDVAVASSGDAIGAADSSSPEAAYTGERTVVEEALPPATLGAAPVAAGWSDPNERPVTIVSAEVRPPAAPAVVAASEPVQAPPPPAPLADPARKRPIASTLLPKRVVLPASGQADAASPSPSRFLVLGSFSVAANARSLAARHAGAAVVATKVRGADHWRVVVPVKPGQDVRALRRRFAAAGVKGAWPIPACGAAAGQGCVAWAGGSDRSPGGSPVRTAAM